MHVYAVTYRPRMCFVLSVDERLCTNCYRVYTHKNNIAYAIKLKRQQKKNKNVQSRYNGVIKFIFKLKRN